MLRTVLVVVLFRHVVLRHFVRAHFALVRVRSVFHSAHYPRFERLSFLQQFLRAFRVGALNHGNAAKIPAALSRGRRARATLQLHGLHALAAHHDLRLASGSPARRRLARRFLLWCLLLRAQLRFGCNFFRATLWFLLLRFLHHICTLRRRKSTTSPRSGHSNTRRKRRARASQEVQKRASHVQTDLV